MQLAIMLLNLLPGFLAPITGISDKIKQLITTITGAGSAVLTSGSVTAPSVQTILTAWAGVLAVLKSDPGLPQDKLGLIDQLEKIVAAALLEDTQALIKVDWSIFATPTASV